MIHHLGEIAALATAALWAFNSICFSLAGRQVGSVTVNHLRLWIGWLTILLLMVALRIPFVPPTATPQQVGWLLLSGLIGFALGDAFLFEAFLRIGPRLSMLWMTLAPVFAALLELAVLRVRLAPLEWTAIAITLGGIALVVSDPHGHREESHRGRRLSGTLLAILGAAGQAVGLLLSKMGMAGGFSPIAANTWRLTAATLAMGVWFLCSGRLPGEWAKLKVRPAMGWIAAGAVTGPVAGVVLSLFAITHAPIGVASTLMSLSPLLLLPVAHFAFRERVGWQAIAGTTVAILGTALLFLSTPAAS
ncbi:MAG TPA: DMT family transporter [Candidatus Aminicenantes bacterium]|nr:DMT family transporter [Candidatus Aminicenantes bacterium]